MSSSGTACTSQKTPDHRGEYTERPSMSTSSLSPDEPLNPRALTAYSLLLSRATCRLGASRKASGRLVTPERRMSSAVMTNSDVGAADRASGRREDEVISTLESSSSDRSVSAGGAACSACSANGAAAAQNRQRAGPTVFTWCPVDT